MPEANPAGAPLAPIERREGVFFVRLAASHLRVWTPSGRGGDTGATVGRAREHARAEGPPPYALCAGVGTGLLALDRARGVAEACAPSLADAGGTLSVVDGRVAVGPGDAVAAGAVVAIQGAPLLVEDGRAELLRPSGMRSWRVALVAFDPSTVGFAVALADLDEFAVRLAYAGAEWAAHGPADAAARIMDARGDWRGSPRNAPSRRVWYAAPPRWDSRVTVRVVGVPE